jgi:hypothetical protein
MMPLAMKQKTLALALMAAVSFVSPLVESFATGGVEMMSSHGLVETAISIVLLFWWYHVDKDERDYTAGRLMNAGVLVLAAVALPIYFVRSRGWRRGSVTIALAASFVLATFGLGAAGEWLGGWLRS